MLKMDKVEESWLPWTVPSCVSKATFIYIFLYNAQNALMLPSAPRLFCLVLLSRWCKCSSPAFDYRVVFLTQIYVTDSSVTVNSPKNLCHIRKLSDVLLIKDLQLSNLCFPSVLLTTQWVLLLFGVQGQAHNFCIPAGSIFHSLLFSLLNCTMTKQTFENLKAGLALVFVLPEASKGNNAFGGGGGRMVQPFWNSPHQKFYMVFGVSSCLFLLPK